MPGLDSKAIAYELLYEEILCFAILALGPGSRSARVRALATLARDTRMACPGRATPDLIRGAKIRDQGLALDSRLRGNERSLLLTPFVPAKAGTQGHAVSQQVADSSDRHMR